MNAAGTSRARLERLRGVELPALVGREGEIERVGEREREREKKRREEKRRSSE